MVFFAEICQPGNYYVPDNKTCEPCEVGTYKVLAGNEDGCVSCAADKTTLGTGATSEAECSESKFKQFMAKIIWRLFDKFVI